MKTTVLTALLFLVLPSTILQGQDLNASEIIEKSRQLMEGNSSYVEIEMLIHRPKWERRLKFKSWMKGEEYALIYITAPAKEEGQVFLKRGNEMWNWLPSIERTIKIPPSMMMQSWMGSDLTNDDLVEQSSIEKDYDHQIAGEENISGYPCYKIKLTPHEDAPVVWGKIFTWISREEFYTLRNEYYDEEGSLVNLEALSDIRDVGDRSIPTRFKVEPADKENHYTVMQFKHIEFNVRIEDSFFSIQNMKRIR